VEKTSSRTKRELEKFDEAKKNKINSLGEDRGEERRERGGRRVGERGLR
jgi:hypothetical protein